MHSSVLTTLLCFKLLLAGALVAVSLPRPCFVSTLLYVSSMKFLMTVFFSLLPLLGLAFERPPLLLFRPLVGHRGSDGWARFGCSSGGGGGGGGGGGARVTPMTPRCIAKNEATP